MAKIDVEIIDGVVERWKRYRADFRSRGGSVTRSDIDEFILTSNKLAGEFINAIGRSDPEYLEVIGELALNAQSLKMNPDLHKL